MEVLVAYMSKTGNTKKVADAIYDEIKAKKTIKPIDEVDSLDGYDLAFLGFPVNRYGPSKQASRFLETRTHGKNIALFMTHAAPEDLSELPTWLDKFNTAAAGAIIVGRFSCQGELAKGVKFIMSMIPGKLRAQAKMDNSKGQPNAARIQKARAFAKEIMRDLLERRTFL